MFAKASGLKAGELVHVIADAHIYDRHIDAVKRIIEKEPYPAPEMVVEDITDFYKFTKNSFTLKDYKYHDFDRKNRSSDITIRPHAAFCRGYECLYMSVYTGGEAHR